MKHLRAQTYLIKTVKDNKFVKVGEITVLLQELYRELEGKNRVFGLSTLAKKKIRTEYEFREIRKKIGNGPIVLTSKKMHFCKSNKEWRNILEDRCTKCENPIRGVAHQSPKADLCINCWLDWRGD